MKHVMIAALLLAAAGPRGRADEPGQAAAARKIRDAWQTAHAAPAERSLHVVCWTPADREFPAGHRDRLSRMLLHIQTFYAAEMARNGFDRRAFGLKQDGEGRVVLHEVRGREPTGYYGKKSGHEIRKECLPVLRKAGIDADQETIAIFCNLATWDEQELRFAHKSPYYAGGTYRGGTAWQLDSPELDTRHLGKPAPLIRDGEYGRISLGKHNSIFIGGMAHEFGHAFGLPHCAERPDEGARGTALMGAGNRTYGDELRGEGRGTFLPFADALRLAAHPLFCGHLEARRQRPTAALTAVEVRADGKAIVVAGTVTGDPPVYGVVAYFDPEGNADYNQTSATAVPAADGRFSLRSDALVRGKGGVLHLVPLHANGAVPDGATRARMRYPYRVADDGTPDLRAVQVRQALAPIAAAVGRGDVPEARRLAGELKNAEAAAVAAALTDATPPRETPAEYRGPDAARGLTTFRADAATVGWLKPTFNRIPDAAPLLEAAGEVFAAGIYAHAPARHEYALGGAWGTFQGKVGVAAGHAGSVRFVIKGDGRELWQSPTVVPDRLVPFDVPVRGVRRLELLTAPTDDGPTGDWGLWLDPRLRR